MVTRQDGLVSVVIAAYDVAGYLVETLDSVLAQEGVELEVVIVDDGSTDGTGDIADAYATQDSRVVVVHQPNGGLGAARNAGISRASGEYLTFCDADDVVPPGAYAAMRDSLAASGSDFAIGRAERFDSRERWQPVWIDEAHDGAPHRARTIEQFPLAIKNILECNRMYRRSSWDAVGPFPVGGLSEGYVPMVESFLGGRTFDVIDEVMYGWRVREDGTSSTQQKARTQSLRDRLAALDVAAGLVAAHGSAAVTSMWHARVLELDLSGYYQFAAIAGDEFRSLLTRAARGFLELADDDALRFVSVHRKVSAWLAAEEHWVALQWLEDRKNVAALRRNGHLANRWPVADAAAVKSRFGLDVPERLLALSSYDTRARATLRRVVVLPRTDAAGSIEVEFDVWLRGVKAPAALDEVSLELRLAGDDRPPHRVVAQSTGRRARAVIDVAALHEWADGARGTVTVAARYSWGDASGEVAVRAPFARLPLTRPSQVEGVRPLLGPDNSLALRLARPLAATRALGWGRGHAVAALADVVPGDPPVRVRLPARARRRIVPRSGRALLAWPVDEPTGVVVPRAWTGRRVPWRWEATARDEAVLVPRAALLELTCATATEDALELTLHVRDRWRLDLAALRWFPGRARGRRGTVTVRLDANDLASITAPTPITATDPGRHAPPTVRFAWALLESQPLRWEIGDHVVRLRPGRQRAVIITVRKPRRT